MDKPKDKTRQQSIGDQRLRPESLMMGYAYDPALSEGALKSPIFHTSTFVFESAESGKAFFELAYGLREPRPSEQPGLIYSRINNPDLQILEERLCLWDDAESSLVFSSGMSAISTALLAFLRPGDVIVHSEPVYGGTDFLIKRVLTQYGIVRMPFPAGDNAALDAAIADAEQLGRVGVIYVETPANPTNAMVDINRCAQHAERLRDAGQGTLVAVDNTMFGPLWQKPLRHGADLVLYSLTKYIGGHSDLIAGACLGAESLIAQVRTFRTILGTMSDPHTGWMVLRSLETLKLRMTCQTKNAQRVAAFLSTHPRVRSVAFPGLLREGDAGYDLYQNQCTGPGSTFSFEIDGGEAEAFAVLNALTLVKLAVSLGGTESLAEHPATMTHSDIPPDEQRRMGITSAMIRISVGVEHPEDLIADLRQALSVLG